MSFQAVPIPSRLAPDTTGWVRGFSERLRDEVARPLFAAADSTEFESRLPDALVRGAILQFRWISQLSEMPPEVGRELANTWLRPPPAAVLKDLQARAAEVLGSERSFQLRRALAVMFTDVADAARGFAEELESAGLTPPRLVGMARIAEATAPQDVLALAWLMVLAGDVPLPDSNVASAAMDALMRLTAERLRVVNQVLMGELPARTIDDVRGEAPAAWGEAHPTLVVPALLLLGLALDDQDVQWVEFDVASDPEDAERSTVRLELLVGRDADPDAALVRVEHRALSAGILGVTSDERGGAIAVLSDVAPER